jgi:hypothetical protein
VPFHLFAAILAGLFCFVMYKITRPFSALVFESYNKLSNADKRNWDTRCVEFRVLFGEAGTELRVDILHGM